jgi:hypothetical protein
MAGSRLAHGRDLHPYRLTLQPSLERQLEAEAQAPARAQQCL